MSRKQPTAEDLKAMLMAWRVCKHVQSNAIVMVREYESGQFMLLGMGAGQPNRVDSLRKFAFLLQVRDKLSEANLAVKKIPAPPATRSTGVTEPMKGKDDMKDVTDMAKSILDDMKKIEETLYQTKNRSGQDPLNYPVRLNNKLAALGGEADGSDYKPTAQVRAVDSEVTGKIDEQLQQLNKIFSDRIPKLNDLVKQKQINPVTIPEVC